MGIKWAKKSFTYLLTNWSHFFFIGVEKIINKIKMLTQLSTFPHAILQHIRIVVNISYIIGLWISAKFHFFFSFVFIKFVFMGSMIEAKRKILRSASPLSFAHITSNGKWLIRPHLVQIAKAVYELLYTDKEILIINMPPRHGKSEFLSKYIPAWYLSQFPDRRVLLTTYSDRFSEQFGRIVMDLYLENMKYFGTGIYKRKQSSGEWMTEAMGGMVSVGGGGSITGRGANLLIIDDIIKNVIEALSLTHQENMKDWMYTTALTRLEPGGKVIVIMTRWQPDDLTGVLIEKTKLSKLIHLKLKAIATEDEYFRRKGGALWPQRYNVEDLDAIREKITPYWFNAMYQQEPSNKGNEYINVGHFGEYLEDAKGIYIPDEGKLIQPRFLEKYGVVDLAIGTKQSNDYTVTIVFKMDLQTNVFVENVFQERMPPDQHEEIIEEYYSRYGIKMIGIESVAYQETIIHRLRSKGLAVLALEPKKEKLIRLLRIVPHLKDKKIYLKKDAPWKKDFIEELERFPHFKHDDQVDAFAYIAEFLHIRGRMSVSGATVTRGNRIDLRR